MRREAICVVLGLLVGAAPRAVGGDRDEELQERLRSLQEALQQAMAHAPAVANLPPVDNRGFVMGIVPLPDLVAGVPFHIRPDNRLNPKDSEATLFSGVAEEAPQPFGTIEEVLELVRGSVWPESWENGGSIAATGHHLIIHNTPAVVRDVGRFLDRSLRARAHRSVVVEADVVEVPAALYEALGGGHGAVLEPAKHQSLTAALKGGSARRLFRGRVTGLAGQRVLLWHGEQTAVLADTDVEVAQNAKTADPIVGVVQAGGMIWVTADLAGDDGHVRLDVEARFDSLKQPIGQRETEENGVLDMPEVTRVGGQATLTLPVKRWALISAGAAKAGNVRIVLVRADLLARGGGQK